MNSVSLGKKGESDAVTALEAAGMNIIARNYRSKYGEVDIIAMDKEILVFAEVKAWSAYGFDNLHHGINIKKQQKIIKTAKYFLFENREYNNMTIRFDVIFVNPKAPNGSYAPAITHLASAFTESV